MRNCPIFGGASAWRIASMAQRVDGDVNLRALAPFRAVVASPRTALGRGLQRAAIDARCRRLALASGKLSQQSARVFDQPLEASRPHPALHLLKNCRPRRIIVRPNNAIERPTPP